MVDSCHVIGTPDQECRLASKQTIVLFVMELVAALPRVYGLFLLARFNARA